MKDLLPFNWEGEDLPQIPRPPQSHIPLLVIRGSFADPTELARITIKRGHFYLHHGWELKDCVSMGLPQFLRFEVLRDTKKIERNGHEAWVLLI